MGEVCLQYQHYGGSPFTVPAFWGKSVYSTSIMGEVHLQYQHYGGSPITVPALWGKSDYSTSIWRAFPIGSLFAVPALWGKSIYSTSNMGEVRLQYQHLEGIPFRKSVYSTSISPITVSAFGGHSLYSTSIGILAAPVQIPHVTVLVPKQIRLQNVFHFAKLRLKCFRELQPREVSFEDEGDDAIRVSGHSPVGYRKAW